MVCSLRLSSFLGALLLLGLAAAGRAAQNDQGTLQPIPDPTMGGTGIIGGSDANRSLPVAPPAKNPSDSEPVFGGIHFGSTPGRFWVRADYLYWWTKGAHTPALATEASATSGLNATNDPAGSLGYGDTRVVIGDSDFNISGKSGFRLTGGMWLDACQNWGLQGDYLNVGGNGEDYLVGSDASGNPVLARPYYDVQAARNWRQLVSYPNTLAGTVGAVSSDFFNSAGLMLKRNLIQCGNCCACDPCGYACGNSGRIDLLAGYRYYGLSDKLVIQENLNPLTPELRGSTIQVTDSFRTQNDFHGVDLGFDATAYRGRWSFNLLMKAAVGNNQRTTVIGGKTVTSNTSGTNTIYEGVYAVRTNSGTYVQNDFTVIPQIGLEAGYQVAPGMRVFLGYNLIYWAAVQRAADAFSMNIDPRNIPPVTDPATKFPEFKPNGSSFWAQGGNVGFEVRF